MADYYHKRVLNERYWGGHLSASSMPVGWESQIPRLVDEPLDLTPKFEPLDLTPKFRPLPSDFMPKKPWEI